MSYMYKYPTREAFRYHFRPLVPIAWDTPRHEPDRYKDFGAYLGSLTDRPHSEHWYRDKRGAMSERAELDYRMAPDITRKDAPFGTSETPTITMKIIGGRQIPVIEKHPVGIDSHGSRIQPLQPITEKPNHLDPRTYGDNPAGYYNTVQEQPDSPRPTTLISKRPDSKDISRVHYKALPPIQANRTRNDMSTVFEKETWTAHREPQLAKETEYKTNYFSDSHLNEMDAKRYSSQRRDHLRVEPEEYEQLLRIMPPNVFLPNDPIDYSRLEPILTRLIAGEMESGNPQELKDVYLEASQHDRDLRGYCSLEVLDNCLQRHKFHIPDLRLVAAKYVDPLQPGKINYEKTLSFLERAVKLKDGDITEDSRLNTPKRLLEDMAETEALRSDRPKYYMSNGETNKLGYYYKDGEVAKLLRTVENELSKSSYFMDWTKWNNAFNKMDRDHRETLSASQIKDICYDNKLPLSDSIVNQILALCEDNNRDGQYRWNDFLDFLSRVRPSNTGLPIPVSKRPLDYAKRIPEPVANWPRTDANTSPERHSPRKESPHREPSPDKRGYADRGQWPDSRYNRPKSYAEPTRHHDGHKSEGTGRVRPLSYKENMRFDGPPRGYGDRGDYGYDRRDGYGYDDYQRPGQYRYDGHQKSDREHQIKQLTTELRDLESKYHMTREAMKSHEKPWPDRYLKLAEALYNSDVSNKGSLPRTTVMELVKQYNDAFNLGIDMNYASLVAISSGNVDKAGNVVLKPFLTNLSMKDTFNKLNPY